MTASLPAAGVPPRRLLLGADAWQVLVEQLGGLALPAPLRAEDGPRLDLAQRTAATAALRTAGLLDAAPGPDLLATLHPSVRAGLTVHLVPQVVVDSVVQRGPERRAARHAAAGLLASGLVRTTVEVPGGRDTGPVELATLRLEDLAAEVVRVLGHLPPVGDRRPVRLDAAASLAAVRALKEDRPDAAAAVAAAGLAAVRRDDGRAAGSEGDATVVPDVLVALADGVRAVARVELSGSGRRLAIIAVETVGGWWQAQTADEDVVLRPLDADGLVTRLAGALAAALAVGVS